MKTKEQVIRYLSRRSFSPKDWQVILQECREKYGSGIRKSLRPKSECSLEEFHAWLDTGIGDGIIVKSGDMTGLYCDNGDGTAKLIAEYTINEKIIVDDIAIDPKTVIIASNDEMNKFYRMLRKQGYQYNTTLATISKRNVPRKCQMVKFIYCDSEYIGILLKVKSGTAYFACSYNGELKRNLSYDLFDIDFLETTREDKINLKEILSKNNILFNKKTLKRAEYGYYYWFITDIFSIKRVADKRKKSDEIRYEIGNYFLDYDKALSFRNEIVDKRKGQD